MNKLEREMKFDKLIAISDRIIAAKKKLFIGEPYKSKMKPGKEKTYAMLNQLQNNNIKEVTNLFQ